MLKLVGAAESVKLDAAVTVRLMVVVCVRLPEVPVMVTVVGPPTAADPLAVKVKVLVVVVLGGLNDAVTPLGRADVTARLTLPLKPFSGFTVIVLVPLLPWAMLRLLGAADNVKLGATVTVRLTVVVCVRLPEVPVIVTVVGPPTAADPLAVKVKVLVVVVLDGLNDAVTPLGRAEVTAKLTLPLKPFSGFTVIVLVPLLPWAMLKLLGAAVSVKLPAPAAPVPARGSSNGLGLALLVTVSAPPIPPTTVGANWISTVQALPAASEPPVSGQVVPLLWI